MTLGEYLQNKRRALRHTQAQAAEQVGVRIETWRSWERGAQPYAGKLVLIAAWAGVSLNKLAPFLDAFPGNTSGHSGR